MTNSSRPPPAGIVFLDGPAPPRDPSELTVRVPRGIRSKRKLLAIFTDKLHFPNYFGWNWDAFEECLRDLSWLPEGQGVTIIHDDLPFGAGGANRGIYLNILASAVRNHLATKSRSVRVIFPAAARDQFRISHEATLK